MKRLHNTAFRFLAGGITIGSSRVVHAHPGHGTPELEQTVWHYLCEPEHVFVLLAAVGLSAAVIWLKSGSHGPIDQ